jgi:hypothetical protein
MSDGSGFISDDLARLVPAVSSGELVAAERGQGVLWPHTPLQVRSWSLAVPGLLCNMSELAAAKVAVGCCGPHTISNPGPGYDCKQDWVHS